MMEIVRDNLLFLKGVNVETVSATVYMGPESAPFQLLTPSGGTIKVLMFALPPPGGKPNGRPFIIANATGSGQDIAVKDSGDSTTYVTLTPGTWAYLVSGEGDWRVMSAGQLLPGTVGSGGLDLNGSRLTIDADADTYLVESADDVVDMYVAGALDFQILANILRARAGSVIQTDTINETTSAAGVTVDGALLKDGGAVFADGATVEVDIVNEATAAAGVTIDGALIKDGQLQGTAPLKADTIAENGAGNGVTIDGALIKDGHIVDSVGFYDAAAPTKIARLDAGAVTAGNTRVISAPDGDIHAESWTRRLSGTISAADLRTLNATPVEMIPAPAAGLYIKVLWVHWFLDYGGVQMDAAAAGDTLEAKYTNGSGAAVVDAVAGNTIGGAAADYHTTVMAVPEVVPVAAAAVVAHINTGEWYAAAGTSELKWVAYYQICTLPT